MMSAIFLYKLRKGTGHVVLTDLEKLLIALSLEHPEYHSVLANREKYLAYSWLPESGKRIRFTS